MNNVTRENAGPRIANILIRVIEDSGRDPAASQETLRRNLLTDLLDEFWPIPESAKLTQLRADHSFYLTVLNDPHRFLSCHERGRFERIARLLEEAIKIEEATT